MSERRYEVIVTGHEDAPVNEYLDKFLSQLDSVAGVTDVHIERVDKSNRDISEVDRILHDLTREEIDILGNAIEAYTEDEK